jgi:hypothetical protein
MTLRDVCKNIKPFVEDTKLHVAKKHLPKATKELAQNT